MQHAKTNKSIQTKVTSLSTVTPQLRSRQGNGLAGLFWPLVQYEDLVRAPVIPVGVAYNSCPLSWVCSVDVKHGSPVALRLNEAFISTVVNH